MGSLFAKKEKPKGPEGTDAWLAKIENRGSVSSIHDLLASEKLRGKRTSGKVKSAVSESRSA